MGDAEAQERLAKLDAQLGTERNADGETVDIRAERVGPHKARLYAKGDDGHEHIDELNLFSAMAREKYARRTALLFEREEKDVLATVSRLCLDLIGGGEAPTREAASYADDDYMAELAWNRDDKCADYVVFNRKTEELTRETELPTPSGVVVPPSMCHGIVTPGGHIPGAVYVPDSCGPLGESEDTLLLNDN